MSKSAKLARSDAKLNAFIYCSETMFVSRSAVAWEDQTITQLWYYYIVSITPRRDEYNASKKPLWKKNLSFRGQYIIKLALQSKPSTFGN